MSEKVLFELRIDADGAVSLFESPEWQAYHTPRWIPRRLRIRPRTEPGEVRRALDSLQRIYDDVYGSTEV